MPYIKKYSFFENCILYGKKLEMRIKLVTYIICGLRLRPVYTSTLLLAFGALSRALVLVFLKLTSSSAVCVNSWLISGFWACKHPNLRCCLVFKELKMWLKII